MGLRENNHMQDFYISNQENLNLVINQIRQDKIVALDTEFTRQTTYYPIPSIIQIGLKKNHKNHKFIIDCQDQNLDLVEFFDLISNQKISKILHSSMQDLQIFYHFFKTKPQNIIDTQVMASFCGFGFNVGYSSLVEKIFSFQISKDQQRSDWQRRPLSKKQIEYALLDVEFLHEIYEKFSEILQKKNRQFWFAEEMQNFVEKSLFKSEESLLKNFSFKNKSQKQANDLKNLIIWREELSQKENVLRQYFLKDCDLENIAMQGFVKKNYPKLTKKMTTEISEILSKKLEEKVTRQNNLFLNLEGKKIFDDAKEQLIKIANLENIPAQFLISSDDLKRIINHRDYFEKIIFGWRYDLFGKKLQNILN